MKHEIESTVYIDAGTAGHCMAELVVAEVSAVDSVLLLRAHVNQLKKDICFVDIHNRRTISIQYGKEEGYFFDAEKLHIILNQTNIDVLEKYMLDIVFLNYFPTYHVDFGVQNKNGDKLDLTIRIP